MSPDLSGQTAVVTGGANGQGEEEVRRFAAAGAHVVIADIDERGAEVAERLGEKARFAPLDVSSEEQWRALFAAVDDWPPVRTLVNNAGVHRFGPLVDEAPEDLERMLRVNVVGAHLGIRYAVEPMSRAGGGSIVNVCSVLAMLGSHRSSSYVASKWALRGLTKAAAMELGERGIRVNAVLPGYIETPMLAAAAGQDRPDGYYDYLPLRRPGLPTEVADLVLFLASEQSAYLTGADFVVDGGMTAGSGPRYW
jgi:3alpha(or 20beta)-hydroxysteroid dehydrogenase